jgi:hypothetical protein
MASQSDADRVLREHLALQAETAAIEAAHKELQAKPFDAAEHREHAERIETHLLKLRAHTARMSSAKRAARGLEDRRKKRPA